MVEKLKILVSASNGGGCSYYRLLMPFEKIAALYPDEVEIRFNMNPLGFDESKGALQPGLPNNGWLPDWEFEDMKWADIVGLEGLLRDIECYAQEDPYFWQTAPLLKRLVAEGRVFDDLNKAN